MQNHHKRIKKLTIRELLKPHFGALAIGFVAVVGEGVANLLQPWPLRIVLDTVLRSRQMSSWLNGLAHTTVGDDKLSGLKIACAPVLGLAAVVALSSYS